jgi:hypothetical protein
VNPRRSLPKLNRKASDVTALPSPAPLYAAAVFAVACAMGALVFSDSSASHNPWLSFSPRPVVAPATAQPPAFTAPPTTGRRQARPGADDHASREPQPVTVLPKTVLVSVSGGPAQPSPASVSGLAIHGSITDRSASFYVRRATSGSTQRRATAAAVTSRPASARRPPSVSSAEPNRRHPPSEGKYRSRRPQAPRAAPTPKHIGRSPQEDTRPPAGRVAAQAAAPSRAPTMRAPRTAPPRAKPQPPGAAPHKPHKH